MQLKFDQLRQHVERQLAGVYLLSGDEPLQLGDAADLIRKKARADGFLNREILHVEGRFDWNHLRAATRNQSLFAEKNLIELNLPTAKPGRDGSAAIDEVVKELSSDNMLIIIAGKLDPKSKNTRWFKSIDSKGVTVQVWPLVGRDLNQWLVAKLRSKNLQLEPQAVNELSERVEGNLLAASQEIEKLHVLYGEGQLTTQNILSAVADNARYDVFKLTDSLLAGNVERALQVLSSLREEKIASPVILWALTREIRLLLSLSLAKSQRNGMDTVFRNNRVWDSRKNAYLQTLARGKMDDWKVLMQSCSKVDQMIKGALQGHAWDVLEKICLGVCMPNTVNEQLKRLVS